MEFQPITVNVHPDSKYNLVKLLEHHLIFYKKSGYRYHPYFEIVDGTTLQPVSSWDDAALVVGCITVYCGQRPVRLIDNIKYKEAGA